MHTRESIMREFLTELGRRSSRSITQSFKLYSETENIDDYLNKLETFAPSRDHYYRTRLPLLLRRMHQSIGDPNFVFLYPGMDRSLMPMLVDYFLEELLYTSIISTTIDVALKLDRYPEDFLRSEWAKLKSMMSLREKGVVEPLPGCEVRVAKWLYVLNNRFYGSGHPTHRVYMNIDPETFDALRFDSFLRWACQNANFQHFKLPTSGKEFAERHDSAVFYYSGDYEDVSLEAQEIAHALEDRGILLNPDPTPYYVQVSKERSFHADIRDTLQDIVIGISRLQDPNDFDEFVSNIEIAVSTEGVFTEKLLAQGYIL